MTLRLIQLANEKERFDEFTLPLRNPLALETAATVHLEALWLRSSCVYGKDLTNCPSIYCSVTLRCK